MIMNKPFKYNEDKICDEIKRYVKETYDKHYSIGNGGFQVQDLLKTLKISKLLERLRTKYVTLFSGN